ncbi:MAG: enoyl-CoA hydratase [Myxococcota bacterium]
MNAIRTERQERVLLITLDRPERKNALTRAMYEALNDAFDRYGADSQLRAAVITGAGDTFTAGNDLQDFMDEPPVDDSSPVMGFLRRLVELEKPLIAAVRGSAVGIGTTLLLHMDLAFADSTARFRMPFVRLGLVPEGGSSLLLPQALGHRRAAELLLLSEWFEPEVARELGLLNQVVSDPLEHALMRAKALAQQAPQAVVQAKRLLKAPYRDALLKVMRAEGQLFGERLRSPEAMEAFRAFFEKREPNFD